ncbi:hypothetical protein GYMLUDRAFT_370752 [Collybiopsis luxurians FD-317 M1]|uniref:Unplaced genomic scaffold GYMLUscaffold_100, whole genome shotgun sequence n=1 Tax=Collybiopsis luxurians FD-317 M1 TaxID=944289 RepID=A0A0D0C2N8_9AGAR|nr:hypothetical protein GYMLUDRAFT_370752 [Collybiopsis luxurians FD-317 M1]
MTVKVLLLCLDDDANITATSVPVLLDLGTDITTASRTLKTELETSKSTFAFFCLDRTIWRDAKTIMIEQLRARFDYDWKQWTGGKLQTVIDYNPDHDNEELVHLLAIFAGEFKRLPPRDWLSELPSGKYFSARPPKARATDAEPAEFAKGQRNENTRIICDRPRDPLHIPIPIALLVSSFGTFQTNTRTIKPSDRAFQFAKKMSDGLCVIYSDESQRERAFCQLLGEFLNMDINKVQIGDYTTVGAVLYVLNGQNGASSIIVEVKVEQCGTKGDPGFQFSLNYLENARLVRSHAAGGNEKALRWIKSRLPSILITHAGLSIQIFGGVMVDRPQVEVLTASVPIFFHASHEDMFLDLARTLTALHVLFIDIDKVYSTPPEHSFQVQHSFPYPRSFEQGNETVFFTYIRWVDPTRFVFEIKTQQDIVLYVKYARRHSEETHRKVHQLGLAPKLLVCHELEGGWKMIVMEPIPEGYEAADDIISRRTKATLPREDIKYMVREALEPFFAEGYVHGDLRSANIYIHVDKRKVLMIDFDWSGRDGKVNYPPNIRSNSRIWRPEAELSLRFIELKHDREMVEHL